MDRGRSVTCYGPLGMTLLPKACVRKEEEFGRSEKSNLLSQTSLAAGPKSDHGTHAWFHMLDLHMPARADCANHTWHCV